MGLLRRRACAPAAGGILTRFERNRKSKPATNLLMVVGNLKVAHLSFSCGGNMLTPNEEQERSFRNTKDLSNRFETFWVENLTGTQYSQTECRYARRCRCRVRTSGEGESLCTVSSAGSLSSRFHCWSSNEHQDHGVFPGYRRRSLCAKPPNLRVARCFAASLYLLMLNLPIC